MIVFLTLLYVGLLAVLVKMNVVKLTLGWKLSPLIWMIFLLLVLFFPMQWGAPSGPVTVYRGVVEIVPNVSGEVIEVEAEGSTAIDKGDVLFKIDPVPFQAEVDRLKAALVDAEQSAKMLPADLDSAIASVSQAEAALIAARQRADSLKAAVDAAEASVAKFTAQRGLTEAEFKRAERLVASKAITQDEYDTRKRNLDVSNATVQEAEAGRVQAQLAYDSQVDGVSTEIVQAEEQITVAKAARKKAELALESQIDGVNTLVAQLRAQLEAAQYDLDQTVVTAPTNGYAIGMSLRPGQRVTALPMRTWMAFVDTDNTVLAVGIDQYALRHVAPGQDAEVVLKLFPGRTFEAKVEKIGYMTPGGQIQPSGNVVLAPTRDTSPLPYGVVLRLENSDIKLSELPAGGTGTAAIYTDNVRATHVIRRVMLRMQTYTNYFIPW